MIPSRNNPPKAPINMPMTLKYSLIKERISGLIKIKPAKVPSTPITNVNPFAALR